MVGMVHVKPEKYNTYCDYPFKQIAIKNWNKNKLLEYTPCCMMSTSGNNKMNWKDAHVMNPIEAFESDKFQKLRSDLLSNVKNKSCETCWNQEDKGIESARLYSQEYDTEDFANLRQLDITVTNKCNLMCRMCNYGNSHNFLKEINFFKKNNLLEQIQFATSNYYPEQTLMPNSSNSMQMKWLKDNTKKIKVLKASGGEPFYDERIRELLKVYIDNDDAKSTILEFDTNGTLFDDDVISLNEKFKLLNHSISIDGVNGVYEYIRYPHSFNEFNRSLKRYLKLNNIFCVHYAFVLSSLNIFNIRDFLFYVRSVTSLVSKNKDFYINFEKVRPYDRGTSINLLPIYLLEEAKNDILDLEQKNCKNLISSIDDAILNNNVNKEKMLLEITLLDKARNQNFKKYLDKRLVKWLIK